ncbi:hypothetical protein LCGC14_3162570 [marine sediment metagenome]|uniref:Uncharacterized protein n=1 Tax=marine sediment metagenome TaxID=412755 RepID=A0A0F8YF81_9ZZZZ
MAEEMCSKRFPGNFGRGSPCSRKAKVFRDGKGFCGLHDPEVVAARRAKQYAKWEAEWKRWAKERRLQPIHEAAEDLLAALEDLREEWGCWCIAGDNHLPPCLAAQAAVAKAKGEKP